jgi:cytochrome c-type biogenesis protein
VTLRHFLEQFASTLGAGSPIALVIAIAAGVLASAVCPCTLPVGIGIASVAGASEGTSRRSGIGFAGAFFAGIVLNLTVLGTVAGRLGAIATDRFGRNWTLGMACLSLVGAAAAFAGPRLGFERLVRWRRPGLLGSLVYGFVFSLGTSVAPLLVLLTVSAANGSAIYGLLLALAFGVGRGLPFLVVGVFASALVRFAQLGSRQRAIQIASGCALVAVGAYYANAYVALI